MGLFDKFKNIFKKEEKEELEKYDVGLEKTRNYFTDKISLLNGKYKKVNDAYFDELEESGELEEKVEQVVRKLVEELLKKQIAFPKCI